MFPIRFIPSSSRRPTLARLLSLHLEPKACLASSAIRCRDVETGPNLGVLAVFPSNGATCRCPLRPWRSSRRGPSGDCRSPAPWTAWRSPADFRRSSAPRAMNKLSRLSAPLGRPIEGQIRAQAQWSRPIVRHPDSYPRSGGCQAEVRRAVFDAKGSGQRWAWPPLRLEPEPQVSTRRSIRPSTRGQHRTPCGS